VAVVTLEYDGHNITAIKGLDFLTSLGMFRVKETSTARRELDEAIEDVENGRVTTYSNFAEYKNGMRKVLSNV